ncbi:MAG: type II secretion system GspH family protein [Campylobacter sp.]|uniref:type II secretion system protein n=1 Tax=Campylobacter sp. TaxID=205 RepID=UPI002AA8850D|nr:type II secretion system protein [Campylobacter sp.]MCI6695216.1 type II secretion system GspH family protein [Campylobacter sp.]MCI6819741.1 type II secretion system GspH family protein [Campylobacter sp.]
MKKGFTMIELIFVIVILGILASVAIPRLAATREDAEISAAVANLRTLVSYATAYYTVKGTFGTDNTGRNSTIKWNEITNVPLSMPAKNTAGSVTGDGVLKVGNQDCILVALRGKNHNNNAPAHIVIAKQKDVTGVCKQVQDSEPLKAYFSSSVTGNPSKGTIGFVAIGSSTSVY